METTENSNKVFLFEMKMEGCNYNWIYDMLTGWTDK